MLRAVHPTLFRIGSYEVASYGVLLTLAFAVGIWVARRRAVARGIDGERVLDVCMLILFTSILGARLLWVATHAAEFRPPAGTWTDAFNPFRGGGYVGFAGLSVLGGVVLATVSALAYLAWKRMPVLATADVLAPSVALGEGITRIGCFLNGCCYGLPCEGGFCVRFPSGSAADVAYHGVAVHATQLYAAAVGFASFALLSWLLARRLFPGAVFGAFLVLNGMQRIVLDLVRHQDASVVWFELGTTPFTANQGVSVALVIAGVAAWIAASRRAAAGGPAHA
jgi:phosphatidylglycerol:prolipoprotein diacylglycerol transferase